MNSSNYPDARRSKKFNPFPKRRLDELLVERGLAGSLKKAQALIMSGQVLLESGAAKNAGQTAGTDAKIEILSGPRFVSRGGDKLAGALKAFDISPVDMTCLDVGASTGGFTDCLLQSGARRVYALDVGHGLLDAKLRSDPRVTVFEGENFRHFDVSRLPERPALVAVDVSFISLKTVLPALAASLDGRGLMLALVKPQFEAEPRDAPGGVVRDAAVRENILQNIRTAAEAAGFAWRGKADSVLKGPKGNQETFVYLEKK